MKYRIPTLILPAGQVPNDAWDFKPHAFPHHTKEPEYLWMDRRFNIRDYALKVKSLRLLRILARLKTVHTPEITSLSGFSETYVRTLLKELQAENLTEWKRIGKYDGWEIKKKGMRLAHRSWNIPKGVHFTQYRGEFRYAGERDRRVARLWRAWLEKAYRGIKIWECWTEVSIRYGVPDALAWGTLHGHEMLFWLEVDSGHSSRKTMKANYERRLKIAYTHSYDWRIPVVFCIMGPPWVVEYFQWCISGMYASMAVIGHDWREFGKLPMYEFGYWKEDLAASRDLCMIQSGGELSFDPKRYPPKPKRRTIKLPKTKSTKPRFSLPLSGNEGD